ncbi:MAG: hypothetical protein H0V66_07650 [Bdellovibrionales bacterium]|nr:hypothetical protein [Bdellovibrionales bacterium]
MKFLLLLLLSLISVKAYSYSNFIGHGYTSCLNCHFNPFGGGPLNDYGLVVSATAIGSTALYPKSWDEEKLAYMSGFLFRKPKQDWLRTQINYRGFKVVRNPGSSETEESQWINMQADARVILKFGENDKFISVFNYGYAPLPSEVPADTKASEWRSREHYVGYRFTPKFGLYAGLMDKVFGIKVIEHIAFARISPQVTQNDQVHGLTAHYLGDTWELGAQGFAGNMTQDADLRMKGASVMLEKTVYDIHRIGASVMSSENEYLKLLSYSAHARLNLKEGSAVLSELGQTNKKTENGSGDTTERFGLLQTYLRPWRGTYFLANIEYFNRDTSQDDYTVRWGPGVQYFLGQRIELRLDLYNTRSFAPKSSTRDSWMYLLQTHLWF